MPYIAERVTVSCAICSLQFDVSDRTARDIRKGKREARCALHKVGRRKLTEVAEDRRFWLDRFDMDDIVFMAKCLTPRGASLTPPSIGSVLTASAPPGPRELGG